MDFSSSNVDDCFNGAKERSPKDDGGSYSSSPMSITLKSSGAECMLIVGTWFHAGADIDCGHYVDVRSGVVECLLKRISVDCALDAWNTRVVLLDQER